MPVLATAADVEDRLGRQLAADELHKVAGLLDELTVHAVREVAALSDVEQPAPLAVRVVVSRAVADVLPLRADGVTVETVGPFTRRYAESSGGGPRLTGEGLDALRVACGGLPSARARSMNNLPAC